MRRALVSVSGGVGGTSIIFQSGWNAGKCSGTSGPNSFATQALSAVISAMPSFRSAKTSNEIPREMRAAGHDMGDGFAIVFVPRTVGLEKCMKPLDPLGHRIYRLQADRDTIIGERKFDMVSPGLAAKIARLHPHLI